MEEMEDQPHAPPRTSVPTNPVDGAESDPAPRPPESRKTESRKILSRQKPDLVPVLTLGGLVLVILAGWLLFPKVAAWMSVQDCLASFRTPSACR